MPAKVETRLTPRQRLTRGLAQTAAGPVDIARGAVGLTAQSVSAGVAGIRQRYRDGQLRKEIAAAQGVLASIPESFQEARADQQRTKRPWLIAGAAAATLTLGGAAFAFVRRRTTRTPEPTTLPPSVQVEPKI